MTRLNAYGELMDEYAPQEEKFQGSAVENHIRLDKYGESNQVLYSKTGMIYESRKGRVLDINA